MSQYKELAEAVDKCCVDYDQRDQIAAILRSLDAQEPVMVYHGRCVIDCGENGHSDVEMLKMIPAGTKLYAAPVAAQPQELEELFGRAVSLLHQSREIVRGSVGEQEWLRKFQDLKNDWQQLPAAQPPELEELRKLVKDFPLNDQDVPIIYDTNEIDLITYALTGDDGEDDSVTVLQRLVRALPGKTVYALLEDAETAAQPQQAKPLSDVEMNEIYRNTFGLIDSRMVGEQIKFVRAIEAAHGIKEQG